jgi:hypothetical protein
MVRNELRKQKENSGRIYESSGKLLARETFVAKN